MGHNFNKNKNYFLKFVSRIDLIMLNNYPINTNHQSAILF